MNSNTTEEQIKNKLETLDTLQAGIVFGREDAWDKLQAQLDANPVRKPFPIFRLAAVAAIFLVFIMVGVRYFQPSQTTNAPDVIETLPNQDINRSDVMVRPHPEPGRRTNHDIGTIGQDAPTASPSPLERAGVRLDSFHTNNRISSALAKPYHKQTITQPVPLPEPQPIAQAPQPTPDAVPPPAPEPVMKVVHINELDKEQAPPYEIADKEIPHPHVMFKMKVIHINDLMKPISQEEYLQEMQNNTAVRIPFFHRPGYDRPSNDQPKSFFRINLSN